MSEPPVITKLRRQGAHDGRAASARIDRVESVVSWMATTMVGALGGPDAVLRNLDNNREDALEVLKAAGLDTGPIVARWDAQQAEREGKAPKQVTTRYDTPSDGDWRNDSRITEAIMAGVSDAEYHKLLRQVQAEHAQRVRQAAAQATRRRDLMWVDQHGVARYSGETAVPLGVAQDANGNPRQTTLATNRSVPELGSEEVPAPYMGDIRALEATAPQPCTAHAGQPGEKFCPQCGKPRPGARP